MYNLENLFLFKDIKKSEIKDIMDSLTAPKRIKKGEVIYHPDSFLHAIGIFLEGAGVAMTKGGEDIKKRFSEGSVFGAASLFGASTEYSSIIIATKDSSVQFIEEAVLLNLFEKHPKMSLNYIEFLSKKIRYLNEKIDQYTGDTAKDRLKRYLLDSMDDKGEVSCMNMSSLAKETGLGRTSLYRAISELENTKQIKREQNKIIVLEN